MLIKKRTQLDNSKENYETGLDKLEETELKVAVIEIEVKEAQAIAAVKKEEADAIAEIVGKEKKEVDEQNASAKIVADECEEI